MITLSEQDTFDTVYFFDKSNLDVIETQKRIPGAVGFAGSFVETVLADDIVVTNAGGSATKRLAGALSSATTDKDTTITRKLQRRKDETNKFRESFPFDIVNLDLEEFLFKPSEPMPKAT